MEREIALQKEIRTSSWDIEINPESYEGKSIDYIQKVNHALKNIKILQHIDPKIMNDAGWEKKQEWISVEDENRLPQKEGFYNVFSEYYEEVATLFYNLKHERFGDLDVENNFSPCEFGDMVTHWKTLPQPPTKQ